MVTATLRGKRSLFIDIIVYIFPVAFFTPDKYVHVLILLRDRFSNLFLANLRLIKRLPQRLSSKESTCNAGDIGDSGLIPGLG